MVPVDSAPPPSAAGGPIGYVVDAAVALVTLQDAATGNRLTAPFITALADAITRAYEDPTVRVVVVRARGATFCAGMHLTVMADTRQTGAAPDAGMAAVAAAVADYSRLLHLIHTGPKPVVALVTGAVKAGGVGIVAACDIVLAAHTATFELSEVLFGLIPANVIPYLFLNRMSAQRVRYLVLSAARLDAPAAAADGLVDEVHDLPSLEKAARTVIRSLLRGSPTAHAAAKRFLTQLEDVDSQTQRDLAEDQLLTLVGGTEPVAAVRAFEAGELPQWCARYKPTGNLIFEED